MEEWVYFSQLSHTWALKLALYVIGEDLTIWPSHNPCQSKACEKITILTVKPVQA